MRADFIYKGSSIGDATVTIVPRVGEYVVAFGQTWCVEGIEWRMSARDNEELDEVTIGVRPL